MGGDDVIIDTAILDPEVFGANSVLIRTGAGELTVDLNASSARDEVTDDESDNVNWEGNMIDIVLVRADSSDTITGNSVASFLESFDSIGGDIISAEMVMTFSRTGTKPVQIASPARAATTQSTCKMASQETAWTAAKEPTRSSPMRAT